MRQRSLDSFFTPQSYISVTSVPKFPTKRAAAAFEDDYNQHKLCITEDGNVMHSKLDKAIEIVEKTGRQESIGRGMDFPGGPTSKIASKIEGDENAIRVPILDYTRPKQIRKGGSRRVAASKETVGAPITEYERERAENIRRNNEFLQKVGIAMTMESLSNSAPKNFHKSHLQKTKLRSTTNAPLRRSTRQRPSLQPIEEIVDVAKGSPLPEDAYVHKSCEGSSVIRYICGEAPCLIANAPVDIIGFHPSLIDFEDPILARIYSLDVELSMGERTLLAAGGHKGRIAVFEAANDEVCIDAEVDVIHNQIPCHTATGRTALSWKGGNGWISQVKFPSNQTLEHSMLLLSTSNDSSLVLWDINKRQQTFGASQPQIVAQAHPHSDGIFGMHELCGKIATASKDGTACYSTIGDGCITIDREISGHHRGTIKGIRLRDQNTLTDCGADGLICILDMRLTNPCTLTIEKTHMTGINIVEWNPCDENVLLSASNDTQVMLHDIRNPAQVLYKFVGHVDAALHKCSRIYRPTFIDEGRTIATPGEGSECISLYSILTGKMISKGHVGYDATVMFASLKDASKSRLWAASRKVAQFVPIWNKKIDITGTI